MKLIPAFAALLVLMQLQGVPRQGARTRTTAPATIAPLGAEPADVLNAERAWAGAGVLLRLAQQGGASGDAAIRALGRLENPSLVPSLFTLAGSTSVKAAAIGQSLYGFDPSADPDLIQRVSEWMWTAAGGDPAAARTSPGTVADVAVPMAGIRYGSARQVHDTERLLAALAGSTANDVQRGAEYGAAIRGLEALARVNTKLVQFEDGTIRRLSSAVWNTAVNDDAASVRLYAFMALSSAHALKPEIVRKALADDDWQVRRLAMQIVSGTGQELDDLARAASTREGLGDPSPHVRYETIRAYARHSAATQGCQPLLDALGDHDMTVVLEAIDVLGDHCKDDEDVTMRVAAEVRVPSNAGPWQRQAHAFVALANRSPERASLATEAFVTHPVWWVRMYAAYAMAAAHDLLHLEKLAYDADDNVRDAALPALRRLDKDRGVRAAVDALLQRSDVQLLRSAAIILKELPPAPSLHKPLFTALQTLTRDGRMTSRDARLELLDALERHTSGDAYTELTPWLRDFDARVAERAALVMSHVSGKVFAADPQMRAQASFGEFDNLLRCVSIDMAAGPSIVLRMMPNAAPLAVEQFLTFGTKEKYYDGTSFHRVVPNFVIQGGSPRANEYSGSKDFWRDEIAASNTRGTVGLSTRGRNTGDAQFFINLADNPRLNGNYTVFAAVENMADVDQIQEGDVIRRMRTVSCPVPPR